MHFRDSLPDGLVIFMFGGPGLEFGPVRPLGEPTLHNFPGNGLGQLDFLDLPGLLLQQLPLPPLNFGHEHLLFILPIQVRLQPVGFYFLFECQFQVLFVVVLDQSRPAL